MSALWFASSGNESPTVWAGSPPVNTALTAPVNGFDSGRAPVQERAAGATAVSSQSRIGLNAANFFLAEVTGVVMPFLGDYLKERNWSETAIGLAISCAGLGVF